MTNDEDASQRNNEKGLFETLLGERALHSQSYVVGDEYPPRVAFVRNDGIAISVPYASIGVMRYSGAEIQLAIGEERLTLDGFGLKPLFEALNQQRVVSILERPRHLLEIEGDNDEEMKTVVYEITWSESLEPA